MEKKKNKFNQKTESLIIASIYRFLDRETKTKLITMSKKQIAAEIGISTVSLDKYLTQLIELENNPLNNKLNV